MKRSFYLVSWLAVTLALAPFAAANPVIDGQPTWAASPPIAARGQLVALTFHNTTLDTIRLANGAPWWIEDNTGTEVFHPYATQALVYLPPGASMSWAWDQKDDTGQQVPSGADYFAKIGWRFVDDEEGSTSSSRFHIAPGPEVIWTATPAVNSVRSNILLALTNTTPDFIYVRDTSPWAIYDSDDEYVYSAGAFCVVTPVPPGATFFWTWGETDNQDNWVEPGTYRATTDYGYTPETCNENALHAYIELHEPECLMIDTDATVYDPGATVGISFLNCLPETIGTRASRTWWIVNALGVPVYYPTVNWVQTDYLPDEGYEDSWNQQDLFETQVPDGWYFVAVAFTDQQYLTNEISVSPPFLIGEATPAPDTPPAVQMLSQNYPNPFNPRTSIDFAVDAPGHVVLRIHDVSGRLVRTLVDGELQPRTEQYTVVWDGCDDVGRTMPSGVYFYSLTTATSRLSDKMVLVR